MNTIIKLLVSILPWPLKRMILIQFWGYKLHKSSYIGFSYCYPKELFMEEGARIDHFVTAIHLDKIELKKGAKIGRSNWITGTSAMHIKHYTHQKERESKLVLGIQSAITKNHHFDCTNSITIGNFSIIGGYHSQFLTHSIDFNKNRQHSEPIFIGNYCFVGTRSIVMGNSILPDYCILGANSLLNKPFEEKYILYAGSPAIKVKELAKEFAYFNRTTGFVN